MKLSSDVHLVSFCFDDGYSASCDAIASLFESRGLRASFCVLTAPQQSNDSYILGGVIGDFAQWRRLAARGHEVMPHGHVHADLSQLTLTDALCEIDACLAVFSEELPGFTASRAIYHCAYNRFPDRLAPHMANRVRAVRIGSDNSGINALDRTPALTFEAGFPLPPDTEADARKRIRQWLADPPSWLVLTFHGVDGEGWGPVSLVGLGEMLDDIRRSSGTLIKPPGEVLDLLSF